MEVTKTALADKKINIAAATLEAQKERNSLMNFQQEMALLQLITIREILSESNTL